jgi:histone-arginine methyltransferase CARM1
MSALDRATADETERPPDPSAFGVYYARLQHQQNMLQDVVRTDTYRRAIVGNADDFRGKVVLDVGAGTGILSFFAAQAGAGRVYAVEASAMAERAAALAASQGNARLARYAPDESRAKTGALSTSKLSADAAWDALDPTARIHVVRGKVEDVTIPEHVDVIISEPLGTERSVYFHIVTRMTTHVKQSYADQNGMMRDITQLIPTGSYTYKSIYHDIQNLTHRIQVSY